MFKLSEKSKARLHGVHEDKVAVVERAIQLTELDFGITEGLRTVTRQEQLVKEGKSWTMNSRHLTGHAVDIAVYDQYGIITWAMRDFAKVAEAFAQASLELDIPVVWGAVWDKRVADLTLEGDGFNDDIDAYVQRFKERRIAQGKKPKRPLLDGPHFELDRKVYPA